MIAGLPMYDLDGLEAHHDKLWLAIRERLNEAGVDAPARLTRGSPPTTLWTEPNLILAQTCGYPLVKHLVGRVQLVATPAYRARGCSGPHHRSLIVARKGDARATLAEFRGSRCALNDEASNTGMNLFRAEIAPLVHGADRTFFKSVILTGSHSASIDAVIDDQADIAAVDCVTFALLQRLRPLSLERVRIIGFTAQTPGLPLITGQSSSPKTAQTLTEALIAVGKDPDLRPTLDALLIDGFIQVPIAHYRAILHVEQIATSQGYPRLQ